MTQTHNAQIDVRQPPIMIRLKADASGQPVETTDSDHTAVLLPQYGLMFNVAVDTSPNSHDEAVASASATRLFGFADWRLPEVAELQLLLRRDRHQPAIDTEYFPDTPTNDWYWTATPVASDPAYAWAVDFYDGSVYGYRRGYGGFVRAVRSVPPSQ